MPGTKKTYFPHKELRAEIPKGFRFGHYLLDLMEERFRTIKNFIAPEHADMHYATFYKVVKGHNVRQTSLDMLWLSDLVFGSDPVEMYQTYMESLPHWKHLPEEQRRRYALMAYILDAVMLLPTEDQEQIKLILGSYVKKNKALFAKRRKETVIAGGFAKHPKEQEKETQPT